MPLDDKLDFEEARKGFIAAPPYRQIKAEAGLNRFVWDLRYAGSSRVPDYYLWEYKDGSRGPLALPGKYQVRLTVDGKSQTAAFEVAMDPRVNVSQGDLQKQFDLLIQLRGLVSIMCGDRQASNALLQALGQIWP